MARRSNIDESLRTHGEGPRLDRRRALQCGAGLLAAVSTLIPADAAADEARPAPSPRTGDTPVTLQKYRYTGRAVRLSDALQRRGIKSSPETEAQIVLELVTGELLPILADWRGRAFYQDERLRDRQVTLVANRRADVGYLQPLMVFTYNEQDRPQFTDYWCDICSIPMYEIQPCECCQGDIRLRFTPQSPPEDVPQWNRGTESQDSGQPDE
jgi:hypothetical protein